MQDGKVKGLVSTDGTITAPASPGQVTTLLVDEHGKLWTAGGGSGGGALTTGEYNAGGVDVFAVQRVTTGDALQDAMSIATEAAQLHSLVFEQGADTPWSGYLMLFDSATTPTAGATPAYRFRLEEGERLYWAPRYVLFSNGIQLAVSSSQTTLAAQAGFFCCTAEWEATS